MKNRIIFNLIIFLNIIVSVSYISGCSHSQESPVTLAVSIAPIKYIVERITCGDFPIEVILPAGANPETYSPPPHKLVNIHNSKLIFITGLLDMEKELTANLSSESENTVNLSSGIDLISGSPTTLPAHHVHGIDPHIWTAPNQLQIMAANAFNAIKKEFPDSIKYDYAYRLLREELERADTYIQKKVTTSPTRCFIIYHPALTYYAKEYSLRQITLESEGKEPSALHLQTIVDVARNEHIKTILYQKEFARDAVQAISEDIGAAPVEIDPLREDILNEIIRITDLITSPQ